VIVVDTSVLVDALRGIETPQAERFKVLLARGRMLLGDLVICEVLRGAEDEGRAMTISETLSPLQRVDTGGERVARLAALHYRILRGKGITVRSTVDLMIGAFCIMNKHYLLHSDRGFRPMAEHLGLLKA
jgi:predicted nucleic acid-binding protein